MRRSTVLVGLLGIVALTAVWWLLVMAPAARDQAAAEDEIATLDLQIDRLTNRNVALNESVDLLPDYRDGLTVVARSVPVQPDLDILIDDLAAMAADNGMEIIAFGATEPVRFRGDADVEVFEIDLDMSLEGRFFEVIGFLFALEDMERLMHIQTLGIDPARRVGEDASRLEDDLLNVTITATVYSQQAPANIVGAGG